MYKYINSKHKDVGLFINVSLVFVFSLTHEVNAYFSSALTRSWVNKLQMVSSLKQRSCLVSRNLDKGQGIT